MWKLVRILVLGITLAGALLTAAIASAHTVTTEIDEVYSGGTPIGSAPWLTLMFKDYAFNQVLLTITASDLVRPEFVSDIDFNYSPFKNVKNLIFTPQSGVPFKSVHVKADGEHAGPIHTFDIELAFATANRGNRFGSGSIATILISTKAGDPVEALDFNYYTLYKKEHVTAAAHIQGIPVRCGDDSAWAGGDTFVTTPEPSTMLLAGLGLAAIARKRLRRGNGPQA